MAEQELKSSSGWGGFLTRFPWWFVAVVVLLGLSFYFIVTEPELSEAFQFISKGIPLSLIITAVSFIPAVLIGLLAAAGCRSKSALLRNIAFFYLAIIGGIPTIIMIFVVAFLAVPLVSEWLGINQEMVSPMIRGVTALFFVYSAVYGDLFRLGAANDLGNRTDSYFGRLGSRTVTAAVITLIAMFKDSSLLSLLAVQEITQLSQEYSASTFRFREAYMVAVFLYLVLTVLLRFLVQLFEQKTTAD